MRLRSYSSGRGDGFLPREAVGIHQSKRPRIGEILVADGALDQAQVESVVAHQATTGQLFGDAAVALGLISRDALGRALAQQHDFKLLEPGDPRVDPSVVSAYEILNPLTEKLRSLRSTVFPVEDMAGDSPRIIVLCGIDNNDDTPGLAANLAVTTAQLGYDGLLVDANFAQPVLHKLFASPNREGLTTLLVNGFQSDPSIVQTAVPNLHLLPAGPAIPNAAEAVERESLCQQLRSLGRRFQFIIIDAGSQPVEVVCAIGRGADGVLLVIERNVTPLEAVKKVSNQMLDREINVLGSVLAR